MPLRPCMPSADVNEELVSERQRHMPSLEWLNRDPVFQVAVIASQSVLRPVKATCLGAGSKVAYGEACRLSSARFTVEGVKFRQVSFELTPC
jgi:hypothetical protein